ncbi:MAG TPA: 3-deoxy-manno-octulosonate cytidylyltransferase, partial [Gaiellaceae bacterium]|nr:3-deoxy-manno-octulosonate cytidylyltransferase [Gaiellaceae bacterium]
VAVRAVDVVVVVPARYASTRFPGKALAPLGGSTVIERTVARCYEVVDREQVVVATDDDRIRERCEAAGIRVAMTSDTCRTGTDRVAEVAESIPAEWYVNVQGDEPFLEPSALQAVIDACATTNADVINAYAPIEDEDSFRSPTVPKVVTRPDGRLLYISRAGIPTTKELTFERAVRQIGLYAFRPDALRRYAATERGALEELEDVEILRFLELGMEVAMIEVSNPGIAIDVPEDLVRAQAFIERT